MPSPLHALILGWYSHAARDLPWRRPGTSAWAVLVSEVMLQQTPVQRVLPAYDAWLARWPTASALAAEPAGEAVRQWGRLGYPRRALRLHAAAVTVAQSYAGRVPDFYAGLRALPGVGDYTAAAVLSFAYGQRHAVLDTNVRRVLARAVGGAADAPASRTTTELSRATELLPDAGAAPSWAAATMELGALVCTARTPRCGACPISDRCAWRAGGRPASTVARRRKPYAGTDRQARGVLLEKLRATVGPVSLGALLRLWPDAEQGTRALAGLVEDGLAVRRSGTEGTQYVLPGQVRTEAAPETPRP